MPRRREVPKREVLPDPKYGNVDVAKFMNMLMLSGKKSVAERIVYGAFEQIQTKGGKDPLEVFTVALNNVKPVVEVKRAVALVVRTIRFRSKCARRVVWHWRCAGCVRPRRSVARSRWPCAWLVNSPKRPKAVAAR